MDIQRYSIHDGPGIRTTVFFKGCHMSCLWCHNPESQRREPEMLFYGEKCIGCRACFSFCKRGAHSLHEGRHLVDLKQCRNCPEMEHCSKGCPAEALRLCGWEMEPGQVLDQVLVDKSFYGPEGGVTCSGGEVLLQKEFLQEFLPMCKEQGISTCLDTTLNVEWKKIEPILDFTDLFLADLKFMDTQAHICYTGIGGKWTIENLRRLAEHNKRVILRMPLIAGVNDTEEEIKARQKLLEKLPNVERVDCFAVTDHGAVKYRALQRELFSFNRGVDVEALADRVKAQIKKKERNEGL